MTLNPENLKYNSSDMKLPPAAFLRSPLFSPTRTATYRNCCVCQRMSKQLLKNTDLGFCEAELYLPTMYLFQKVGDHVYSKWVLESTVALVTRQLALRTSLCSIAAHRHIPTGTSRSTSASSAVKICAHGILC